MCFSLICLSVVFIFRRHSQTQTSTSNKTTTQNSTQTSHQTTSKASVTRYLLQLWKVKRGNLDKFGFFSPFLRKKKSCPQIPWKLPCPWETGTTCPYFQTSNKRSAHVFPFSPSTKSKIFCHPNRTTRSQVLPVENDFGKVYKTWQNSIWRPQGLRFKKR